MKQSNNNLFRYGRQQSPPEENNLIPRSPASENQDLKIQLADKQNYINKLISIINKQRNEISDQTKLIKCLENDLRKYKTLSQELQETVIKLSEENDSIKRRDNHQVEIVQESENDCQLFEKFLMVSVQKADTFENIRNNPKEKMFMLKPQVLYQYPSQDELWQHDYKVVLPSMIFPFGVEVRVCKKTDSMSELNSIIYSGLSPDKYENVSVLTFKSDEAFVNSNSWLRKINPNNLLYCICLEQRDLFDEEQIPTKKKRKFISTLKTYVFMTKVPFISMFVDILQIVISDLKLRKAQLHASMTPPLDIDRMDYQFHTNYVSELEAVFQDLLSLRVQKEFSLRIFSENLNYNLPDFDYLDCEWGSFMILNILNLEQFVEVLCSLLCEQQIVILSEKRNIISASMLLFYQLMKPFKWVHPFISSVSSDMMQLLDSPVPIFVGILKDERFINVEDLYDSYDNVLFLEYEGYERDASLSLIQREKLDFLSSPSVQKLCHILSPLFVRLKLKENLNDKVNNDMIPTPDDFEIRTCREIFDQVRLFYRNEIICNIKSRAHQKELQAQKLEDVFMREFLRTQTLTYFLEETTSLNP